MEAVDVRGRFVWHQLMTRDVPAARTFYSKLTGWKTIPWPLDPSYTVCHADTGPVAGFMQMPAEVPAEVAPHWIQYIGTRDVDGIADASGFPRDIALPMTTRSGWCARFGSA